MCVTSYCFLSILHPPLPSTHTLPSSFSQHKPQPFNFQEWIKKCTHLEPLFTFPLSSTILYTYMYDDHRSKQFSQSIFSGQTFPAQPAWAHQGKLGSDLIHQTILGLRKDSNVISEKRCKPKEIECKTRSPKERQYKRKREIREYGQKVCNKNNNNKNILKKSQEANNIPSLVSHIWRLCLTEAQTGLCTASSVQYKCIGQEIHKSKEQTLSRSELESPGSLAILSTKEVSIVFSVL